MRLILVKVRLPLPQLLHGMDEPLRERIIGFLAHEHVMTLATIRPDGFPQATLVYYVNSDLILHFATDPSSQKAGNIRLNNKVSVAIAGRSESAYKLKALYASGVAERIADPVLAHDVQLRLFKAIPEAKRFAPFDPKVLAVYSIAPVAISLVDYESGYGNTVLVEL